MKVARSAGEVLAEHTTLELDRVTGVEINDALDLLMGMYG